MKIKWKSKMTAKLKVKIKYGDSGMVLQLEVASRVPKRKNSGSVYLHPILVA